MKAPTGLGAVVEDSEGRLWVRASAEDPEWRHDRVAVGIWESWAEINAVRVLSRGVS